jgi:hypothetical protein
MSLGQWLQAARIHLLLGPQDWATVMAEADLLEAEHGPGALAVVARLEKAATTTRRRRVLALARTELQRRRLH